MNFRYIITYRMEKFGYFFLLGILIFSGYIGCGQKTVTGYWEKYAPEYAQRALDENPKVFNTLYVWASVQNGFFSCVCISLSKI